MKLLSSSIFLAVVLAAAPASANDHLMRVTEIGLSGTANAASQFIELSDPGEGFPATYNVVVYNAAGVSTMSQPIILKTGTTRAILANAEAQTEYTLTVDTNSTTPVFNLNLTLPAVGAVCFRRQDGGETDTAGTRIHCLGWGNATSFPISTTGGTEHGDAPPAGMSLQKLSGCVAVGTPSPKAANTGTCPLQPDGAPPPDAGPTPDGGGGGDDDGNPDNGGGGDDGCTVGVGPGWLGGVGIAGLLIAGGALRRRKR